MIESILGGNKVRSALSNLSFLRGEIWQKADYLPVILQTENSECGLACMAMVLNFHGHHIDINTLRVRHGSSQHGVTLKSLIQLADRVNLSARPLRVELNDLNKLKHNQD